MHLTTPFTAVLGLLIAAGAASPIQKDKVSIPADVSDDQSSAMTVPIGQCFFRCTPALIIAVTWNSCIKDCMAPKLSKYQGRVEDREWQ
ncbi:hypothetical protein CABS01_02250 [Colletotrichum abscissum]|uniref:Uncharacterized protein n=2 Tax=Colletotrichum acutatum species complex TaxID=2707335 RepID=A0A9P9XHL1_9PEZI|nr:uncharacterized protein CTAM01_11845 [Colletotrichum tamarilloi]XP_060395933.1 uncharacterized protein CABS01_02250 [Colletotrichum abscissum]KAI3554407.1 hypothetical protein CABS02_05224 [Colletotrichum abscissum]KAK1487388.1 hypothetical protein CTAM01_11845 [Colletotrichum tamarilloi]KAK1488620.1 hypothetical protein CABS01_02250 [Colletotrichum abscissum]